LNPALDAGVRPDWLPDSAGRMVWEFLTAYHREYGQVPGPEVLAAEYPTYKLVVDPEPVDYILDKLREIRRLAILERALVTATQRWDMGDAQASADVLSSALMALAYEVPSTHDVDITVNGPARLERYRQAMARDGAMVGIPTGFQTIDEATGGYRPGQLIVITGPPKAGKTYALLWSALAAWYAPKKVLFTGFEMSNIEQEERIDSMIAGVAATALRDGRLTRDELRKVERAARSMELRPNFWLSADSNSTTTVSGIIAKTEKYRPDINFVDGIYLMADELGEKPGDWKAITNITRGLKKAAQRTGPPIVATTQSKANKMYGGELSLTSLGYSSSFDEDADLIIGVEPTKDPDISKVKRIVGRACGPFEFWIRRDWKNNTFTELTYDPFGESDDFDEDGFDDRF